MTNSTSIGNAISGDSPTVAITSALNELLKAIRVNHPELPQIALVVGASGVSKRRAIHGHFAPKSWHGDAEHEILLSGESLARGAVATLGTLLHESAHAIANARAVQDTSNHGRYHNKKFKAIGEEVGIDLESAATLGWSLTTVPESTQNKYRDGLKALEEALTSYRVNRVESKEKKPSRKTKVSIDCGCFKPVTVSLKWFEDAVARLTCNDCLEEFHIVDENGSIGNDAEKDY